MSKAFSIMLEALSTEDYEQAGRKAAKLSIGALNFKGVYDSAKECYKIATKSGVSKSSFANGLKAVTHHVQEIAQHKNEVGSLVSSLKSTPKFKEVINAIKNNGFSEQALTRITHDVCAMVKTEKDALNLLNQIRECSGFRSTIIPQGLRKPLRYNVGHLFTLERDKCGGIKGFHFDYNGLLQNRGRIQFLHTEEGLNGLYRALIKCPISGKAKESSFFSKNLTGLKNLEFIDNVLSKLDYSLMKVGPNGKIFVETNLDQGKLIAHINPTTCEVLTCYYTKEDWLKNPLMKILFSKGTK